MGRFKDQDMEVKEMRCCIFAIIACLLLAALSPATGTATIATNMPAPLVRNGETWVPLRFLTHWLGGKVSGTQASVRIALGTHGLILTPPRVFQQGNVLYVQLRPFVESLGVPMAWAPATQQVTLTRPTTGAQLIFAVSDPDTTISPASPTARQGVHAVWEVTQPLFLGSVRDGTPVKDAEAPASGTRTVKLYSFRRYLGLTRVTARKGDGEEPTLTLSPRLTGDAQVFAIAGRWNALPRPPYAREQSPALRRLVADFLASKGLPAAPVKIDEVEVVDLNGDGEQETLIVGNNWTGDWDLDARTNDYGFILLARQVQGRTQTLLVDGLFYPKKQEAPLETYSLAGVLDVDGEGAEEIIVDASSSDEVGGKTAYRLRNGKLERVMEGTWQN